MISQSPITPTIPKLIPAKKAAEIVGIQYQTMRKWIAEGRVDYTRRGGRNFFKPKQIEAILELRSAKKGAENE